MTTPKKLIEVALPLEAINSESAREKSIRHGHPSTLHLWWARRPLAAARAVIWSSLVDDPSSHPEQFPTEEEQNAERQRLFRILEKLVKWENSNNPEILDEAKAEILKSTHNDPPALLDPFAGGGAIPLEAQRLGLEAHAHDLNPVAVMINKAMIEIPPKFAGQPPVNPATLGQIDGRADWSGAKGLAEDVRYYGEWMKQEAFRRIGHLYPKVKVPKEQGGGEVTVIAWIWARTVKCPNPACGCEMPLVRSFVLSKKKGKEAWVEPHFENGKTTFTVHHERKPKIEGTTSRKGTVCACCGTPVGYSYIRQESRAGKMSAQLMAVVGEGRHGRLYISPDLEQQLASVVNKPDDYPTGNLAPQFTGGSCVPYGLDEFHKLFTNRQLTALTTFSALVGEAQQKAEADAVGAGLADDHIPLRDGGTGARAYGEAVGVYLAFAVDKAANLWSSICSWMNDRGAFRETFARQAIPMVWDFAESNPFSKSGGSFDLFITRISDTVECFINIFKCGEASQFDAQSDCDLRNIMVSTDPPYYDNIGYADLSDFFYVWMRQSLKNTYPDLFRTMLVPKAEELVATPYRFDGSIEKARDFFEDGMYKTCCQLYQYAREDVPVTIYYAYKQSDTEDNGSDSKTASTGWETMLTAIIRAGFTITGTWPMRTESPGRSVAQGTNALASSIVLVCRKRPADAPKTTRRSLIAELRRELRPALQKLQSSRKQQHRDQHKKVFRPCNPDCENKHCCQRTQNIVQMFPTASFLQLFSFPDDPRDQYLYGRIQQNNRRHICFIHSQFTQYRHVKKVNEQKCQTGQTDPEDTDKICQPRRTSWLFSRIFPSPGDPPFCLLFSLHRAFLQPAGYKKRCKCCGGSSKQQASHPQKLIDHRKSKGRHKKSEIRTSVDLSHIDIVAVPPGNTVHIT